MTETKKANGFDKLMHIACVDWGFCGCIKHNQPLHVDHIIPAKGPVSADNFVDWLFLADDMNPNSDAEHWDHAKFALRAAFVECMGGQVVDASFLHWSDVGPRENKAEKKFRGKLS